MTRPDAKEAKPEVRIPVPGGTMVITDWKFLPLWLSDEDRRKYMLQLGVDPPPCRVRIQLYSPEP